MEKSPEKIHTKSTSNVGGRRPGAGRKPGSITKKTREIAERAAKEGITPLEVMISAMREAYEKGGAIAAFPYAKDAAPYMHPRLAATELTGKNGESLAAPTTIIVCGPDE